MTTALTQEEIDRSDRFEAAFNRIHNAFRSMLPHERDDSFVSLLIRLQNSHYLLRRHYSELRRYARLRNSIVHEYLDRDYYIAVPHIDVVLKIEAIADALTAPPSALSVAARPVLSFQADADLTDIMIAMEKHRCTSIPIYDGKLFVGLLTEDGITKWIVRALRASSSVEFAGVPATAILPFESPHNVVFFRSRSNVFELEQLFEDRLANKEKVEAVILTENGSPNEAPLGIVTSWDLVKIDLE